MIGEQHLSPFPSPLKRNNGGHIEWAIARDDTVEKIANATLALSSQKYDLNPAEPLAFKQHKEGVHYLPRWADCTLLSINHAQSLHELLPRGRSRHSVAFARATFEVPDGVMSMAVAIKPYRESFRAFADAIANHWVLDRGFNTTDPILVLVTNQSSFIVSPAIKEAASLDTELWHKFPDGPEPLREHLKSRMENAARVTAVLNVNGIGFGDVQLRNFIGFPNGTVEPIDWEEAMIYQNPPAPDELLLASSTDLKRLYSSLRYRGVLRGGISEARDQFRQLIYRHFDDQLVTEILEGSEKNPDIAKLTSVPDNLQRMFDKICVAAY